MKKKKRELLLHHLLQRKWQKKNTEGRFAHSLFFFSQRLLAERWKKTKGEKKKTLSVTLAGGLSDRKTPSIHKNPLLPIRETTGLVFFSFLLYLLFGVIAFKNRSDLSHVFNWFVSFFQSGTLLPKIFDLFFYIYAHVCSL